MIFQLLFLIFAMCGAAQANEQTAYNFVYYYPPGGGHDAATSPLIKYMERNHLTVNKVFFKSCVEAITYVVESKKPSYLLVFDDDLTSTVMGPCPNIQSLPRAPRLITNLTQSAMYICTSPSKSQLTLADLTQGKRFIGSPSVPSRLITDLKKSLTHPGLTMVPYSSSGKLKASLLSNDLDFFYATGIVHDRIEQGSKCLLSSTRINSLGLPFIGTVFPEFTETPVNNTIWGNAAISNVDIARLKEAFMSPEFSTWIKSAKNVSHSGLGKF